MGMPLVVIPPCKIYSVNYRDRANARRAVTVHQNDKGRILLAPKGYELIASVSVANFFQRQVRQLWRI